MKKRTQIIIAVVILVLVFFSLTVYEVYFYPAAKNKENQPTSTNFLDIPVGDVIVSKLSRNYGGGISNIPLNMTAGENISLTVSLYLQVNANVTANFQVLTHPTSSTKNENFSSQISSSFNPQNLSVIQNVNASTIVTIRASSLAPSGQYDCVISFFDVSNPSWTWGTNIQINVN